MNLKSFLHNKIYEGLKNKLEKDEVTLNEKQSDELYNILNEIVEKYGVNFILNKEANNILKQKITEFKNKHNIVIK